MAELVIYGASDDLVETEGEFREEFGAKLRGAWRGKVLAPNGDALVVTAEFDAPGPYRHDWTLGVENSGTWPAWPIRFGARPDREGDPAIIIEVPAGTIVEELD